MKEKILAAYEGLAGNYDAHIEHKPHNAYYDRPNTLKLIGNVNRTTILDATCGPGKYAEILLEQGVTVTGFEKYDRKHFKELNKFPGFMHIRAIKRP